MKKILKTALTCTLLLNLSLASVAMASPENTENTDQFTTQKFTEVQTSGTGKAKVGKWQGDDTIIMDEKGNQSTLGELKAQTNVIIPDSPDQFIESPNVQLKPHNDLVQPFTSVAYGNAWPYISETSSNVNCYGYSLRLPWSWNPGDGDNVSNVFDNGYFTDPNVGAALIIKDGTSNQLYLKSGWKKLSSRTAAVTSEEHRIAFRVGWIDANGNGKVDVNQDVVDYHFMVQNDTGRWSEKHGQQPSVNSNVVDPGNFSWDLANYSGFYNSAIVYIAAKIR